jgi:hypothetical protein
LSNGLLERKVRLHIPKGLPLAWASHPTHGYEKWGFGFGLELPTALIDLDRAANILSPKQWEVVIPFACRNYCGVKPDALMASD